MRNFLIPIDTSIIMGLPPNTPNDKWLKHTMRNVFDCANTNLQSALQRQNLDHGVNAKIRQFNPGNWVWRYYCRTKTWLRVDMTLSCLENYFLDITYKIQKNDTSP